MVTNVSPSGSSAAPDSINDPFKVIIVGAGPCGLSLAHALTLANIDFIVLERKEVVAEDVGASLVLSPATMRVLDQFGVVDKVLSVGSELQRNVVFGPDGKVWGDTKSPQVFSDSHGIGQVSFHRAELVQTLYDTLSPESKTKIHFGQQITDISIRSKDSFPVTVTCSSGKAHHGSVLIGADGVHSLVRRTMRNLALQQHQLQQQETATKTLVPSSHHSDLDWDPENPFPATYKCLWATFPNPDNITGIACDTRSVDKATMYVSGLERSWIFLYQKLLPSSPPTSDHGQQPQQPQHQQKPQDTRYTHADEQAMLAQFRDFPMTIGGLKISDALETEQPKMGMSDLGEGICKQWSFGGRIVLVGDACHKFMPNAGQGFNSGLQDVVGLCNLLHGAILEAWEQDGSGGSISLSTEKLERLFKEYQTSRVPEVEAMLQLSVAYGRMQTIESWKWRLLGWLMRGYWMQKFMIGKFISPGLAKSLILDFVPFEDRFKGSIEWELTCS